MEILLLMDKMGKFLFLMGKNMGQINIDRENDDICEKGTLRKEFCVVKTK